MKRALIAAAALVLLVGCATAAPSGATPEVIHSDAWCGGPGDAPRFERIADRAARDALARELPEARGLGDVDLTRDELLLASLGPRPTAGYGVHLLPSALPTLRLGWTLPPAGALLPQVISHPCLVLRLPRQPGAVLVLEDAAGRRLATAP